MLFQIYEVANLGIWINHEHVDKWLHKLRYNKNGHQMAILQGQV